MNEQLPHSFVYRKGERKVNMNDKKKLPFRFKE